MPHLYMFYIGGSAGRSNIEVHDVQFVVSDTPEEAWPALREAWFGDKHKVHLDGYSVIDWADGHDVILSRQPAAGGERLYFVNVGGYAPDTLAELHAFDLFVAKNETAARRRALAALLPGVAQHHKDNLKEVDGCLLLAQLDGWHIHLWPNPAGRKPRPAWQGYQPIGRKLRAQAAGG